MNQPYSACRNHVNTLVRISDYIRPSRVSDAPQDFTENTNTHIDFTDVGGIDVGSINVNQEPFISGEVPGGFFVEEYPGAAKIVSQTGTTFMDDFDADIHAGERQKNIFYPFASRDEWQIASYLLRSGLSMSAIDDFLSLELVSCTVQRSTTSH
jgi:hypothetical protein